MNNLNFTTKYLKHNKNSVNDITCPEILYKAVSELGKKHVNVPPSAILNILNVDFGHMICSKKIKIDIAGEILSPGQFAMIFLKSGMGKDYIRKDVKNYLLKKHILWFQEKSEKHYRKMLDLYETQLMEEKNRKNQKQQELETKNVQKGGNDVPTSTECPF